MKPACPNYPTANRWNPIGKQNATEHKPSSKKHPIHLIKIKRLNGLLLGL